MNIFVNTYNVIEGFHRWDGATGKFEYLAQRHDGMAIVMRGTHLCKSMRGVKNQGMMTVAHLSGVFKEDEKARREFYKLIDMQ